MEQKLKPGRPAGSRTFEPEAARAFGSVVRNFRTGLAISQEELGNRAQIERSHKGKIERGQHLPNLALILRIASALDTPPGGLVDLTSQEMTKAANKKKSSKQPR